MVRVVVIISIDGNGLVGAEVGGGPRHVSFENTRRSNLSRGTCFLVQLYG